MSLLFCMNYYAIIATQDVKSYIIVVFSICKPMTSYGVAWCCSDRGLFLVFADSYVKVKLKNFNQGKKSSSGIQTITKYKTKNATY